MTRKAMTRTEEAIIKAAYKCAREWATYWAQNRIERTASLLVEAVIADKQALRRRKA